MPNPASDNRSFTVGRLVKDSEDFFGLHDYVAAGALSSHASTDVLTVSAAYTEIVAWLGAPPPSPGGGGAGGSGGARVAASVAVLGAGNFNGEEALIPVGTWPDQSEVRLRWSDPAGKWIGDPITLVTESDQFGVHLLGVPNYITWQRFKEPIPYGKPRCQLNGQQTLPVATLNVTGSIAGFAASGLLKIRDQGVTYTGKGAGTFTGCSGGAGTFASGEVVTQGDEGGWGLHSVPLIDAGAFWAAGLRLQEHLAAFMVGSLDNMALDLAPYWIEANSGDQQAALATPPTGGLGITNYLTGPSAPYAGALAERPFVWRESGWVTWTPRNPSTLAANGNIPLKRYLLPVMHGRMNGGSGTVIDTGEISNVVYRVRWTS